VQFTVVYYRTETGTEPVRDFLTGLRRDSPTLHTLLVRGRTKLEGSWKTGRIIADR